MAQSDYSEYMKALEKKLSNNTFKYLCLRSEQR